MLCTSVPLPGCDPIGGYNRTDLRAGALSPHPQRVPRIHTTPRIYATSLPPRCIVPVNPRADEAPVTPHIMGI